MNILTISEMTLKNFKGIRNFSFHPSGNTVISGENATGKTTIIDGFFWLLFGKDSQGKSDFQLKPVDKDGQEINHLETEVTGTLDINGKIVKLKKRFYEKYTKRRGEALKEFTGHSTDYFIDDVPAKKKEYDAKVATILNVDAFELITNPMKFNNLHWTNRRQILIEMCGDITDQDVIDSDKKLVELADILGETSIDDHKKKIQVKKREINKELEQIPVRIAENQEAAKNAIKPDLKRKKQLEKVLEEKKEALRLLTSNEALSKKRVHLNEVNSEIQKAKNDAERKRSASRKPIQDFITKLESEQWSLLNQIKISTQEIESDERQNKSSSGAIKTLHEDWYAENEKQIGTDNMCPYCKQELPMERVASAIESFNIAKSTRLEEINEEGRQIKASIEDREKAIATAKKLIDANREKVDEINKTLETKKAELNNLDIKEAEVDDKEKKVLEIEISALLNGSKIQEDTATREINEAQESLNKYIESEAAWKAVEKARVRISELSAQEKELAAEFERFESELFLIEKFIIAKVNMIENQIDGKFNLARFKMFNTQINGGIEECCETLFDGVPFNSGLNNAARINVGLDIIKTMSDYYGFRCPVFIDNAESVNEIIPMDCQIIKLVVSKDKNLKVISQKQ